MRPLRPRRVGSPGHAVGGRPLAASSVPVSLVRDQPPPLPFRPVPNASSMRFRTPRRVTLVARVIPESIPASGGDAVSPDFFSSCCSAARTSLTNAAGGARPAATALRNPAAFAYVSWSPVLRTSSASAAATSIRAISALSDVRRPAKRPPVPALRSLYRSAAAGDCALFLKDPRGDGSERGGSGL